MKSLTHTSESVNTYGHGLRAHPTEVTDQAWRSVVAIREGPYVTSWQRKSCTRPSPPHTYSSLYYAVLHREVVEIRCRLKAGDADRIWSGHASESLREVAPRHSIVRLGSEQLVKRGHALLQRYVTVEDEDDARLAPTYQRWFRSRRSLLVACTHHSQ